MNGIGGGEEMAGRAGAGQRGGELSRDMARLADAGGEDRSGASQDQPDGAFEGLVDGGGDRPDRGGFGFDHLAGKLEKVVARSLDYRPAPTKINSTPIKDEAWNIA